MTKLKRGDAMKKDIGYAKELSAEWVASVRIVPYTVLDSIPQSWVVEVQFRNNPEGRFTLETARGGDRIFKSLDGAFRTIRLFWSGSVIIEE